MQATSPPDSDDKRAWRRWLRERLRQVEDPAGAAARVRSHLETFLAARPPGGLAAFAAMPEEIDLRPLVAGSRHRWHFPRIVDDRLHFHAVREPGQLVPDNRGIDTPPADLPESAIETLDLILVPGLGFGRDGSRLGRGKGFYDRALATARAGVPLVAIAFDEQIVDAVPTGSHDLPVTHLLTPTGLRAVPCRPSLQK
jgi:5-formyltetrahydrofolate cyclo-ligase